MAPERIHFSYTLTPRSRVSAGRFAEVVNAKQVHSVIPGTTVRGALGAAWWSPTPSGYPAIAAADTDPTDRRDQDFDALFRHAMRVNAAVPRVAVGAAGGPGAAEVSAVLRPMSATRCKYAGTPECPDGEWHDRAADPSLDLRCECGGTRDPGRGWDTEPVEQALSRLSLTVPTTRTALQGGVPVQDRLFTRPALVTEVVFVGTLVVTGERSALRAMLEWLQTDREVSVGGQRSTLGRCRWTCRETPAPEWPTGDVAVRLRSPAILLDELGAPTTDLVGAVRDRLAEVDGGGSVSEPSWTRPVVVAGWNGMAGLPKPEEYAVDAGSTVVVQGASALAVEALARGLGVRQREGYGEVEIVSTHDLVSPSSRANRRVEASGATSGGSADPVASPRHTLDDVPVAQAAPEQQAALAEADPAVPADPVRQLVASIGPARADATLKGMRAQARLVRRWRDNGFEANAVRAHVLDPMARLPWMRDLSSAHQEQVKALVAASNPELAGYLDVIETLLEDRS